MRAAFHRFSARPDRGYPAHAENRRRVDDGGKKQNEKAKESGEMIKRMKIIGSPLNGA